MAAPIVVAKGKDLLAQKIKALARESGIMTIENKPLAQALFKTVEVGDSIPSQALPGRRRNPRHRLQGAGRGPPA